MDKKSKLVKSDKSPKQAKSLGKFFAHPYVQAISQVTPITAGITAYIGGRYAEYQYETLLKFIEMLNKKAAEIEEEKIDKKFIESTEGTRIIGKIFRGILKDNRIEKIKAMTNLTVNLFIKSKLNVDEREVYVDILDNLNSLQLSILKDAMLEIKNREGDQHRGFGWEEMAKKYEDKGVTGALLLQSIRTLESNGLVNKNDASIQEKDKTHYVTMFGEQFYAFISQSSVESNSYL